ncbi:hypothetical protein [Streptomyces sp. NBC_01462]|uniref:hypothetical protein n=1 Tax=Streptomyces sp. NBC_01462 TaxID=2903876 RepID=UPI002E332C6D|nr:hypothetical protein [Streptomyces sp. NBC_01462]
MIRHKAVGVLGALALLPLVGCSSGDDKAYVVPDKLCGVPAKPALTKELLPGGDKLRVVKSQTANAAPDQYCTVHVDGDIELVVEGIWQPAGTTAEQAADKAHAFNSRSADEGRFALEDHKAFTVVDCKNTKYKSERFSIEARLIHSDGDMSKKLQRFLDPFSEAYRKTLPCES